MSGKNSNESILEIYIFETTQNIEQLEALILERVISSGTFQLIL